MFSNRKFISRELLEKKRKRRLRLFLFYFVCLLLIFSIFIFIPRLEYFAIKDILVSGTVVTNVDELSQFVRERISGNYIFVIPKNNWLLYPRKSTERGLLESFKRLNMVDLSFEGNNILLLEVAERKPDWVWCSGEKCFFMDDTGLIFDEAPNFSGNVYFKSEGGVDLSSDDAFIGKYFAPTGWDRDEVKFFITTLSDFDIKADSLFVTEDNDIEIKIVDNGYLKLSPSKDLNSVYNDLKNSIESGEIDFIKKYEYIDMRFPNKIFFK